MEKIISNIGGVLVGSTLIYLVGYHLLKLWVFFTKKCWKHKRKIDLSMFSTGELIMRDGTCSRECIFQGSCSRHITDKGGLSSEERDKLLKLIEDYKNKRE